ncbi:C45 family autoproteolytic acyltransferase/hydolase [Christiangramia sediminis]|uniref:C45 family autoproteolytic acyltransferase/hydrolase n=1 Tax=Christiangramia sediminis TaxID=2881336 RepID=A0A9X1LH24_9FLAO|nr:C45 family autoproteolytic acyltransferase/hydolase [Christiangramia sediminis]MCB7480226.1 C45 family autoproteolytic acyltransferase/hydrolase [Christiangramia sediminis]
MKVSGLLLVLILTSLASCGVKKSMQHRPDISGIEEIDTTRIKHSETFYSLGNNQLFQNEQGIWELYLEGDALERGVANGNLTRELIHHQEIAFMDKLQEMVPSENYRGFLKSFVSWFNRKLYLHVPEEYKQEIYGVSRYGLERYDDFAPGYIRMLYFHGAHDIGHALQDLMLVGCTSFAAWDSKTADGDLLLGRNFDFYAGDEFGDQKIAAFVNPDSGHKFMMYTWGGMIGAVSGMNVKGISVTINAGKSKMPFMAKTPISLLAREILQYASSTAEAIEIAKNREVFVSEAIMVGSGDEKKAILIEVSPSNFGVYEVQNSDQLICSNHFQSEAYLEDDRNLKAIEESHSQYRYDRMQELVSGTEKLDPEKAVSILRNMNGLKDKKIGLGNEKAINQLLAHHGIVFKPAERKVWVSSNPYQMGEFVAYDLDKVFDKFENGLVARSVADVENNIPESEFIKTKSFQDYEEFRKLEIEVKNQLANEVQLSEATAQKSIQLNPDFWEAWFLAGKIYYNNADYKKAVIHFKQAKQREVTTLPDLEMIEKMIKKSYRKL